MYIQILEHLLNIVKILVLLGGDIFSVYENIGDISIEQTFWLNIGNQKFTLRAI